MLYEVLLAFLSVAYCYWLYSRYHSLWKHIAKFRGPTTLPIIGNIHQVGFKPTDYLLRLRRWVHEHNYETFRLYAGPQPYIVMSNPKHIEMVLSSTSLTYKEDVYNFLLPWLGRGLLVSNDQYWVKHRKAITPSFHFQILQDFLHVMNGTTDRFIGLLDTFAATGNMFDFQEIVKRCTMDVICETAMGTKVNSIESEECAIPRAIEDLCFVVQERVFSLMKRSDILFRLTKAYRMQQAALKILRRDISKIIDDRRATLLGKERPKHHKTAFLDNLLTVEIDGKPLTFEEIFEEVNTFMFEGHDTTASCIAFTIFCLSRHPEIQQKVFDEQLEIFGRDLTRGPTYQELQDMQYLEMVIRESLRIFPSVPTIARTTTQPVKIDGYVIPKGVSLGIFIIALGTNPHIYENPYKFQPERFDAERRTAANPFEYVPFSAGPRNCIGQKFAAMELKTTISKIVRNFDILPAIDGLSTGINDPNDPNDKPHKLYDPQLQLMITLKSANGLYIRLRKRTF